MTRTNDAGIHFYKQLSSSEGVHLGKSSYLIFIHSFRDPWINVIDNVNALSKITQQTFYTLNGHIYILLHNLTR